MVGERVSQKQKKLDKVQKKSDRKVKKHQKKGDKSHKQAQKPRKRVDKAADKTVKTQKRFQGPDKYRPMMKESGPFKQDERWNASKGQIVIVFVIGMIMILLFLPFALCLGFFLIVIIGAVGGVKVFLKLISFFSKIGTGILKLMYKLGLAMYNMLRRIFRAMRGMKPF